MRLKPIKVGIIGAGGIAQGAHMPGYQKVPGVEMVAVADVKKATAKQAAERFNIPTVLTDWRDLVAMKEIDAVSVCTPNAFHKEPTVAALQAGKHVLVEKPIAMNAKEGEEMIAAARKAGRILMVGLNNRFRGDVQAIRRAIDAKALGEIYYAEAVCTRRRGIPGWGVFIEKAMSGGGALVDIGVHALDLTLHLMGYPKPVSVSGCAFSKLGARRRKAPAGVGYWNPAKFDVDDLGVGIVRFADGACLFLKASWAANIAEGAFNSVLVGTEGGCELSPLQIYREQYGSLVNITPVSLPQTNSHAEEIRLFVEAIRQGKPSPVPAEEALVTQKILDGVYESTVTGSEVKIR